MLDGTSIRDVIKGQTGADVLNGEGGDDTLVGAAGSDSLNGGYGADTYRWSTTHGSETINDSGENAREVDRLVLTNVASGSVTLKRANG
jgi:Ca2+-binding RTX toxin-like protein